MHVSDSAQAGHAPLSSRQPTSGIRSQVQPQGQAGRRAALRGWRQLQRSEDRLVAVQAGVKRLSKQVLLWLGNTAKGEKNGGRVGLAGRADTLKRATGRAPQARISNHEEAGGKAIKQAVSNKQPAGPCGKNHLKFACAPAAIGRAPTGGHCNQKEAGRHHSRLACAPAAISMTRCAEPRHTTAASFSEVKKAPRSAASPP